MRFTYAFDSVREGDVWIVHFPGVPGAVTQVEEGEVFDEIVTDCLVAALGGYVQQHKSLPRPATDNSGSTITLDILTSAKLALAIAMADAGVSNVALARKLGVNEKVVRRLLDLDHVSRIDRLESALAYFGLQFELSLVTKPSAGHGMALTRT